MDRPLSYPILIPEAVLKLAFNGGFYEKPCSHLDQITHTESDLDVCPQCVESGDVWPGLRMCMQCGFVGCCDTSVNKHMMKHCEATGHVLIRSIRLTETWMWCYADETIMSKKW
jgi:uncharacterized UBP type Zn finger protein